MSAGRSIAVTGAGGYIGARLCRALLERGQIVRALARRDPGIPGVAFEPYDLRKEISSGALSGIDVVIHAATETARGSDPDIEAELAALDRLLDATKAAGASLIFISSQSARPDAPTSYGLLKARAEQVVLARQGAIVRPGQVFGGDERALWGSLVAIAHRAVAIPWFIPEPKVQPIHVDDLASALATLASTEPTTSRIYCLADPEPVPFSCFIRSIAMCRFGHAPMLVPVPIAPILAILRLGRMLGVGSGLLQRLQSLAELPRLDSAADMDDLVGLFKRFPNGVTDARARKRALIREGHTILRYALGKAPQASLLRDYARAVLSLDRAEPLCMSSLARMVPQSLIVFDQPGARDRAGPADPLSQRIDLAVLLGESSTQHVDGFMLGASPPRRLMQMLATAFALPFDVLARLVDLAVGTLLDRARPKPAARLTHAA